MASLEEVVAYCQHRLGLPGFPDFPGAVNGLQMANDGRVSRLGAAVDASLDAFERAAAAGVDFLVVHHGMFWGPASPWTGPTFRRLKLLLENNLAVYSAHLPLDAHPELGNNVRLARLLGLEPQATFLGFEGRDIGLIAGSPGPRDELRRRLETRFPRVTAIEFGASTPQRVAIVTGGGGAALDVMAAAEIDTLVTGELREHHYTVAQEAAFNLYLCGHYATEVFGVCALAEELAARFSLPWQFVRTENPL